MNVYKTISIVAMAILGIAAYVWLGSATKEYFLPGFLEASANGTTIWKPEATSVIGMFWPISWSLWSLQYIAIHYTLAVFVSLFLLVFTWPVMGYGTQLARHKKAHKTERLKRQLISKAELDEYLRKEGLTLTPHNDG